MSRLKPNVNSNDRVAPMRHPNCANKMNTIEIANAREHVTYFFCAGGDREENSKPKSVLKDRPVVQVVATAH